MLYSLMEARNLRVKKQECLDLIKKTQLISYELADDLKGLHGTTQRAGYLMYITGRKAEWSL